MASWVTALSMQGAGFMNLALGMHAQVNRKNTRASVCKQGNDNRLTTLKTAFSILRTPFARSTRNTSSIMLFTPISLHSQASPSYHPVTFCVLLFSYSSADTAVSGRETSRNQSGSGRNVPQLAPLGIPSPFSQNEAIARSGIYSGHAEMPRPLPVHAIDSRIRRKDPSESPNRAPPSHGGAA
ncbi:hypothetical protein IWZ01DRAFT_478703 [Phyllosticta capitalensis]